MNGNPVSPPEMAEKNCHAFLLACSLAVGVGVGVAHGRSAWSGQASVSDLRLGERELLIKPLVGHLCCFQAGNGNKAPSYPHHLV